jgi:hypothetical protein
LDLPRELRDQIYRIALTDPNPFSTYVFRYTWRREFESAGAGHIPVHFNVALLRTCRQIHEEASSVLYGENTFLMMIEGDPTCLPRNGLLMEVRSENVPHGIRFSPLEPPNKALEVVACPSMLHA